MQLVNRNTDFLLLHKIALKLNPMINIKQGSPTNNTEWVNYNELSTKLVLLLIDFSVL